jgi:hypothetical protein
MLEAMVDVQLDMLEGALQYRGSHVMLHQPMALAIHYYCLPQSFRVWIQVLW